MSIANYTDLQNALADWLIRADLTTRIPDFITLFEAVANRRLRTRWQETSTNLTPSSGSVTLPADYLSWRRVTWTGTTRVELEFVEPSYLQAAYPTTPQGIPKLFSIEGSTLKIRPTDGTALEFDYFGKIPALASNATNWLLSSHPDLYLFGSLIEAEMYGMEDNRAPMWKARRDELFDEVITLSNKSWGA
jgi:hypothetical protein